MILATFILAEVAVGSKVLEPEALSVAEEVIVTSEGSNSHVPPLIPPEASTLPKACRLSLLEVSTKPPIPVSEPLAVIKPAKFVYSSLHTITLPPSPLLRASAVISAPSSITVAKALGSGPLP